jgi:heme oxygenase (mycobilin-producing)
MNMSVVRINEFVAAEGKAAALREFMRSVVDTIREAEGCLDCQLLVAQEDEGRLAVVETWQSVAAHRAAASLIPEQQLTQVRSLLGAPPSGRYYTKA